MKNIGVYTNLSKDTDLEVTKKLVALLSNNNINFQLFDTLKNEHSFKNFVFFTEKDYSKLDLVITIGGDGTVLNVVKDCGKYNTKILAINKGTKGFLTEIELENIDKVLDIINGNYAIDKRILIEVCLKNNKYLALNEAFVSRKTSMTCLNAKINDLLVDSYQCDGLLVATPTGSTAYSLSAGGPIISPNASVMCITPVCSHSLRSKPIIVGDTDTIEITLEQSYEDAILTIDGVEVDSINVNNTIKIKKSSHSINFLRLKESSFYSKLLNRLHGLV
ncbi:MAG: NAD(+)/NADH kinase [Firmicutes bacterium]|nr:NAD(+)/NADH kinase [Bacillota bacterium]